MLYIIPKVINIPFLFAPGYHGIAESVAIHLGYCVASTNPQELVEELDVWEASLPHFDKFLADYLFRITHPGQRVTGLPTVKKYHDFIIR